MKRSVEKLGACMILLCALASGCHASFTTAAPSGFVELAHQTDYDWRAASADGLVLAAREIDHEPKGELEFWSRAVEVAMRQRGGYALLTTNDFTTGAGLKGRQLKFGHDEGNRPHLYYVSVIVTDSKIYLLEAGGSKPLLEQASEAIDRWVHDFRVEQCAPFPLAFACRTLSSTDQPRPDRASRAATH